MKPKLLDQVRYKIRTHHYSRRTEKTYVSWIKQFIFYHGLRQRLPVVLSKYDFGDRARKSQYL